VIFDHIVRSKTSSPTVLENDLALLSATVSYFAEMRSQMRLLATVCSRLQHTASVFLQLAQNYVSHLEPARKRAKPPTNHSQYVNNAVDLDIRDVNITNYLEWLPEEIETKIPAQEGDWHGLDSFGVSQRRRMSGNMFDWFSWDTYYAVPEA